jgi:hypothetical protein
MPLCLSPITLSYGTEYSNYYRPPSGCSQYTLKKFMHIQMCMDIFHCLVTSKLLWSGYQIGLLLCICAWIYSTAEWHSHSCGWAIKIGLLVCTCEKNQNHKHVLIKFGTSNFTKNFFKPFSFSLRLHNLSDHIIWIFSCVFTGSSRESH